MNAKTLKLLCGALTLAVGGAGYAAYRSVKTPTQKVVTQTVTASSGNVTERVTASGTVQADSTRNLSFTTSGKLIALPVTVGQQVKAGDVLGRVDPTTAQTQLDNANSNLLSAQAKLDSLLAGLTAPERLQLTLSSEQAQAQITSAKRSLADAKTTAAQNLKSYQSAIDAAQSSLDNAQQTAQINSTTYQSAIDQAQAGIDNANATAALNAKGYQSAIDAAQTALDNAKKNADLNAKTYQAAIDAAQAAVDNAKTNAGFSATSSNLSVAQAQQSVALASAAAGQAYQDVATGKGTTQQWQQALQSLANAQASLVSAQNNAAASSAKDAQTVASAQQQTLTNALNSQTAGLEKDQESIKSAQTALVNAQNARDTGVAKDAQTLKSAQSALVTAQTNQTSGLAKDAQSIKSAQTALANAVNAKTVGQTKDAQSIATATTAIANAQLSYRSTQAGNAVKLEPAKAADITSAKAAVAAAKVAVTTAQNALNDTTLKSPIDGTITSIANNVGETVAQGTFMSITATGSLEVKAGFSEANTAKLKVGQRATVTFDALPTVTISAVISGIDPVATSVQNVATYYATMEIPGAAAKGVKPGMSASAEIVVNEAKNTVVLPSSAISTAGGRSSVTIRKGTVDTRTVVTTGIVGSEGTQVLSGVNAGDVVVVPSGTGTSSTGTGSFGGGAGVVRVG